ncbi:MAG TPA: YciI family protein [Terriglobia bacterium]|nr:YciI family protein [Terriglobia bacterium]
MKYILLMTGTKAGVDTCRAWSPSDVQAHFKFLMRLNKELSESGELVANEPLAAPDEARVVRAGKDGTPVTDGVFPESKEFLLGYWMVDVESPERAYQIAARLSAGPGPGGVPTNMPIEVRQMMSRKTDEPA